MWLELEACLSSTGWVGWGQAWKNVAADSQEFEARRHVAPGAYNYLGESETISIYCKISDFQDKMATSADIY